MLSSLLLPLLIFPSVTSLDTTIASDSTNCVHDALCKTAPGHTDGFTCNLGSTSPNACDLLNAHYDRWEAEAKVLAHLFKEIGKIQNATSQLLLQCNSTQLLIDLQILKGRQAVSGAVQGGQVFMFVAYLVTIAVLCLVKHCNKHRERVAQSEFELIEAKLQSNKAKRRAAAARAKSAQEGLPRPART